jgi:hypothetical protein
MMLNTGFVIHPTLRPRFRELGAVNASYPLPKNIAFDPENNQLDYGHQQCRLPTNTMGQQSKLTQKSKP